MAKLLSLMAMDSRSVVRDPVLLLSLIGPILLGILIRVGLPHLTDLVLVEVGLDLVPYYPGFLVFLLFLTAMLGGVLTGFIILDDRDEQILLYFSVTPFSRKRYVWYRLMSPLMLSGVIGLLVSRIAGIVELEWWRLVSVVILASLEAPICGLLLASFAANKVEGLAYSKLLGVFVVTPLVGLIVDTPWRFIAAVFPPFWLGEVVRVGSSQFNFSLALGLTSHLLILSVLVHKFNSRVN